MSGSPMDQVRGRRRSIAPKPRHAPALPFSRFPMFRFWRFFAFALVAQRRYESVRSINAKKAARRRCSPAKVGKAKAR